MAHALQSETLSESLQNGVIDIKKFAEAPLHISPYDHIIVPGFIAAGALEKILNDYPLISKRGSFPLSALQYGEGFKQLLDALRSVEFQQAVEEKFSINLTDKPTMITVRGICGNRDGKVHTDTASKILSLLLYMNPAWEKDGGRLRVLRSENIDDVAAEIPPASGTLLVFRRSNNSFHGHKPYAGPRKVVQLNWVTDLKFVEHTMKRHSLSAIFKKLNPFSSEY